MHEPRGVAGIVAGPGLLAFSGRAEFTRVHTFIATPVSEMLKASLNAYLVFRCGQAVL